MGTGLDMTDHGTQSAHVICEPLPITPAQKLFERWQRDHDERARDELVQRFLPLARKLARRYTGAHEPVDDLMQVASLGLVKAIDRFDYERGVAFSSFAVPTILGELKRYFRDFGWSVHVSRGVQDRALKIEDVRRRLTGRHGRSPSINELAEYMEVGVEEILEAVEATGAHHAISFETPRDDGDGEAGTLGDSFGSEDERFELVEFGATVARAAEHLSERERQVLALRFVRDMTQTEIAEEVGVSQMQVSRILRKAIARLRQLTGDVLPISADE